MKYSVFLLAFIMVFTVLVLTWRASAQDGPLGEEAMDFEQYQANHERGEAFRYSSRRDRKRGVQYPDEYIAPGHDRMYKSWVAQNEARKRQSTSSGTVDFSKQKSSNAYTGPRIVPNNPTAWNQNCGSCVYHATTGNFESVYMKKVSSAQQIYISKQMLMDTADNDGEDDRCSGWNAGKMIDWMASEPRRAQGGLYPPANGRSADHCGKDCPKKSYNWWCGNRYWPIVQPVKKCSGWWIFETCDSYYSIGKDRTSLRAALLKYGPFPVSIKTDVNGGVSAAANAGNIWNCDDGTDTNHAVLLVGWGPGYFLIKNSWGPNWGEGGYFRSSSVQSRSSNNYCIRKAYAPAIVKVWTSGWTYQGSVSKRQVNNDTETLNAEELGYFNSLSADDLAVAEAEVQQEVSNEDLPIGGGLPLRTLVSSSSKLVAFTAPSASDPDLKILDSLYATITFGPLGNAAFIEAEDMVFTIDANIVANYAPMQQIIAEVQGKKVMKLGGGVSAFMIEFLPQDSRQFDGIDLTPMKLLEVGVEVQITKVNAQTGADEVQNFDLGQWQPVLLLEDEGGEEKDILRHEMCIEESQRQFLEQLGAVRQIKVTLKVPKVDLPSAIIGQNKTFKVHIERFSLSTCGALMAATGDGNDQLAVTDAERAASSSSDLPIAAIVAVAVVAVLVLLAGVMYIVYSRQKQVEIQASERRSNASRRGGVTTAGSHRSQRSMRTSHSKGRMQPLATM